MDLPRAGLLLEGSGAGPPAEVVRPPEEMPVGRPAEVARQPEATAQCRLGAVEAPAKS